jgi:hypothetical protein
MKPRKTAPKFALCLNNSGYPASLELHKIYRVVPDVDAAPDGDLRVIDESGEDYLYPANYFLLINLPRDTKRILAESYARPLQPAVA